MSGTPALRNERDCRSLVLALSLAYDGSDPGGTIRAAASAWGCSRLGRVACAVADALRSGSQASEAVAPYLPAPLHAAIRAGEERGDLPGGLSRALGVLERRRDGESRIAGAAVYPLAVACLALGMGGLVAVAAAPSLDALRREAALLTGTATRGGFVGLLSAHPVASAMAFLGAAVAVPLAILVGRALSRRTWGARVLLRLPWLREATRHRAAADFAETFGDHLAAGEGLDRAWTAGARTVSNAALQADLLSGVARIRGGDPASEVLASTGLPPYVAAAFAPAQVEEDNGVLAATLVARRAGEEYRRMAVRSARVAALLSYALAVGTLGGLVLLVMVPLLEIGGIG